MVHHTKKPGVASRLARLLLPLCLAVPGLVPAAFADDDKHPLASLPLRLIGPAYPSGRISDFAFHTPYHYLVATASGGLWETTNDGTTWQPLFDGEASYALGVVEIDPSDALTIWVGSGENNAQRSVAYGDGVYRSTDGGKSWDNVGLKDSGHISAIWIDPADGAHVLVAAQGPLWNAGGDRGLYETRDGGETWRRILEIDEHTGVNEFIVHPDNPQVIVASSYQRRRHVWTLINGGPGSGIHRTSDGGKTWQRIKGALPKDHMGRIGLAAAPSSPARLYAIIEANDDEKGVYRSDDFGQSWKKRSDHLTTSPQYYNELVVDPMDAERVYSLDTFTSVSNDGGKTFTPLSTKTRHVDDHALWINPANTKHLVIGGDGGIYSSWDRGQTWRHIDNLPLTQFYRAQPDNAEPFYNVCGGTQDNNSLCAPSRTTVTHGVTNADWTIILGGDGYKPQSDPTDPNIIYTQYQYGGLARYDRRTQERLYITPLPPRGVANYKWNWNTPLLISPHNHKRIYYAAEYVFRSDDRGDSWEIISPDLTRQIDRNRLEVMDRIWSVDSIAKNDSTSIFGSIIGFSESPVQPDLLYAGTDDGIISVSSDGGENWSSVRRFRGVPDMSLVEDLIASSHSADVAYAVFDNHKRGDFKPYVYKTSNQGKTWQPITGNLPSRGSAHTIAEDHVDPNLLFVGTEFGLYFSQDGGASWHELDGLPTIAVRDIEIQQRESDLVIATFGRGIYILDDYSPLRTAASRIDASAATLFPVRDSWLYVEGDRWGTSREPQAYNGDEFFVTPNPEYGARLSYYLKDGLESRQAKRRAAEIEREKDKADTPYPDWDTLRREDQEREPSLVAEISDASGSVIRRVAGKHGKGLQHLYWDMRLAPPDPVTLTDEPPGPWSRPPYGPMALPGEYSAQLVARVDGVSTPIGDAQTFRLKSLNLSPEITPDRAALQSAQLETAGLLKAVTGANQHVAELRERVDYLWRAMDVTPAASTSQQQRLRALQARLDAVTIALQGDGTRRSRNEPAPLSISDRVYGIRGDSWHSQSPPTALHQASYQVAVAEFEEAIGELRDIGAALQALESAMGDLDAPWTPSRLPVWPPR
ncbi:MAG: glycosyl hydrolase [Pseudomonadota bacterium]